MNNTKLKFYLFNFKKLNQNKTLIIRLNKTYSSSSTSSSSTTSNSKTKQTQEKLYPHGIDLKNLKPKKRSYQNNYNNDDFNYTGAFLLAGIPIITFCLGVWQIQRREWKLSMIKLLEERTKEKPIEIPEKIDLLNEPEYEYRPIKVKGHFDHSREVIITTRQDTTGLNTKPGGYVVTPFILSDRNLTILVNRGFIPYTHFKIEDRKDGQIENEIELVGLLRHNEKPSIFVPENKPTQNEWHWRNINLMAICLETAPIYIDALFEETLRNAKNEPIGPVGGQTIVNLRNEHLNYIITWFTLSFLTSIMWYKNFGKHILKFK